MSTNLAKFSKIIEIIAVVCISTVYCFWNGAPINTCLSSATFHTKVLNETHMGQYLPMNNSEMNYTVTISKREYKNLTLPKQKPKQDSIRGKYYNYIVSLLLTFFFSLGSSLVFDWVKKKSCGHDLYCIT